ncbi:MAG: uracil-DNA glycosylase family protein [Acidobacteriota bacterium]|nr:uracil-DNA glycosylase family protein [Acidobacteriota bacterium]
MDKNLLEAFRAEAAELDKIDLEVYHAHGRDPLQPIFGEGDPRCRIALFGRDPGREEVRHQMPFIGAGGQKIRGVLQQELHGEPLRNFEDSVTVGKHVFWANTLPYKPLGNKAWSMAAKKRFHPLVSRMLMTGWQGREIITLGREAFLWFGIGRDRSARQQLEAFWKREDRFSASLDWTLTAPDHEPRPVRLHPLPHPSPLNAAWYARFDGLLAQRLRDLDLRADHRLST